MDVCLWKQVYNSYSDLGPECTSSSKHHNNWLYLTVIICLSGLSGIWSRLVYSSSLLCSFNKLVWKNVDGCLFTALTHSRLFVHLLSVCLSTYHHACLSPPTSISILFPLFYCSFFIFPLYFFIFLSVCISNFFFLHSSFPSCPFSSYPLMGCPSPP